MEEKVTTPSQEETASETSDKKKFPWKKALAALGIIIVVAAVGIASYWFGMRRTGSDGQESETPTEIPIKTDAMEEDETAEEEEADLSPTGSPTASPTVSPTPAIKTKTLSPIASLDGFRSSNNGGNDGVDIRAGRNVNLVSRGFASFDLSDLPQGATVTEATLRLYQYDTTGSPYGVGGNLLVDHLTYGDALDSTDYAMPALVSGFTTLTKNSSLEWKDADVTDQVKDDVANARTRSQFRIHFTTEVTGGDVTGDFAYYESTENTGGTGKTPQLVVKYY